MELKNVFIDAEKSLGNITFAGAGRCRPACRLLTDYQS